MFDLLDLPVTTNNLLLTRDMFLAGTYPITLGASQILLYQKHRSLVKEPALDTRQSGDHSIDVILQYEPGDGPLYIIREIIGKLSYLGRVHTDQF